MTTSFTRPLPISSPAENLLRPKSPITVRSRIGRRLATHDCSRHGDPTPTPARHDSVECGRPGESVAESTAGAANRSAVQHGRAHEHSALYASALIQCERSGHDHEAEEGRSTFEEQVAIHDQRPLTGS